MSVRTLFLLLVAACVPFAVAQSTRPDLKWLSGGHIPSIQSATYSPDGTIIGSTGYFDESGIKLWKASDGTMLRTLPGSGSNPFIFGPMIPVTFFPDGKTVVAIGEGSALGFWNTASGRLFRTVVIDGTHLAVSPDGATIAVGTRANTVKVLRASDGVLIRTLTGPTDIVEKVTFSPDGSIVAGGDRDGFVRTWRVSDGAPLLTVPAHVSYVEGVCFSPDGTTIVTGGADNLIKIWNSTSGALVRTLTGHTDWLNDVACSPDGQWIASASWDHTVRLWNPFTGMLLATLPLMSASYSVAFSPNSARLVAACDYELREYDVNSQALIRNLVGNTQAITGTEFTPDSENVVVTSYDGSISVRKTQDGSLVRRANPGFGFNSLGISPDGSIIAAGCIDRSVKIVRFSDLATIGTLSPGTYTYAIAFSPNGARIATGHLGGDIDLWDATTFASTGTLSGHTDQVNGLAYTSDGALLLSASEDATVRVWNSQGGFVRALSAPGEEFSSLAISPDNQLALAGTYSGKIYLWNIGTGGLVYSFQAHPQARVNTVSFASNGALFYTAGSNRRLNLWRLSDHSPIESYSVEMGGVAASRPGPLTVDISPNGKSVVYGRDDATVALANNALLVAPTSGVILRGQLLQGSFQDLLVSDDVSMVVNSSPSVRDLPVEIDVIGQLKLPTPTRLSFIVEAGANVGYLQRQIWMHNFHTGQLELLDTASQTTEDQNVRIDLGANFARFIGPAGEVKARLKWGPASRSGWQIRLDQVQWSAGL
jgi:WD40 repeat protein